MRPASEISGLLASELMERDVEIRRLQAEVRRLEIALERARRPEPSPITTELAQRDELIRRLQEDVRRLEQDRQRARNPDPPPRPAPPALKRTYRIKEACEALGIGRTKLYEMINRGELSTLSIGGSRLIRHEELAALISAGDIASP